MSQNKRSLNICVPKEESLLYLYLLFQTGFSTHVMRYDMNNTSTR